MTTRSQPSAPDPATLTGVRSGKSSYYRAYVRSDERMQRAVRAMDSISRALVRTLEGPRGLLEEVVRAAASHPEAEWTLLALSDGHLRGARPRFPVLGPPDGPHGQPTVDDTGLPAIVRRELGAIRAGHAVRSNDDGRWVRVPMTLEGRPIGCPGRTARSRGRPRAGRPVGAAHPRQPGRGLAAHLGAVPGPAWPCTGAPSFCTTRPARTSATSRCARPSCAASRTGWCWRTSGR
ncbi:hypothetical protein [Nocardioides sp. B-3]|uniref:hypothetical protein n=1 Tax=Nocardioides sp. B-3 TaxID=2895565 RepID=UPI002152A013|nr:hypothetical protein [Nocardioides sp. B-3]UUZ57773.1 hypothetical protein LP418_15275 [Nocardioides sp. B-3]